ncbi:MAG: conjugal transfer protein [Fusobacterium necrophorum]|nr:conjugal transfer protein [Fusobacterium necrophorum]
MRINDFHNTLELVKQGILQSEAECLKLLKVVRNNQRYDFRSQRSINLEAIAYAKFDYWRERSAVQRDDFRMTIKEIVETKRKY